MDWTDRGIVLSARKHGESGVILSLLTEAHGRHLGLVRGGAGRRARGLYEPGNLVEATWRARLEDHPGERVALDAGLVRPQPAVSFEAADVPNLRTGFSRVRERNIALFRQQPEEPGVDGTGRFRFEL